MKRALLARYTDDSDEFWCPPKGDVRGAARKTKGSMEKFSSAPAPIKIFRAELDQQLRQRFFAKAPDDVTIMCLYLDPRCATNLNDDNQTTTNVHRTPMLPYPVRAFAASRSRARSAPASLHR